MIILCDVDEVLFPLHQVWLGRYNSRMGTDFKPSDIRDWDLTGLDIDKKVLFSILWEPDLYEAEPIHESVEGVMCLRMMDHRVVFVTSSTDVSAGAKMRWLQRWNFLPTGDSLAQFKDVVIANDKSLLKGDVMIDDHVKNFHGFDGDKLLFDAPHNRSMVEDGFIRVRSWHDVVNLILRLV